MATKKVKDLAVRTGEYVSNGETKGRFENIGSMFKKDDGTFFILLKKTFNPAGVETEAGRDSIIVGVYDLRDDSDKPQRSAAAAKPSPANDVDESSIPF